MLETHSLIIDHFEGALAVVELDGQVLLDLPRWLLPADARADDVLTVAVSGDAARASITIQHDTAATAGARAAARAAVGRLQRRDPGGDYQL